jgi:hypothetical protein
MPSQQEFASLLEASVVLPIAGEYDLANPDEYRKAREILASISATVPQEQANGFNPSATGTGDGDGFSERSSSRFTEPKNNSSSLSSSSQCYASSSVLQTDHQSSRNRTSSHSSASSAMSDTSSQGQAPRVDLFDNDSTERKTEVLAAMFPHLRTWDVTRALKTNDDNFHNAMEELFTIQYLESTGQRPRSIDAFFKPEHDSGSSKGKARVCDAVPSGGEKDKHVLEALATPKRKCFSCIFPTPTDFF